MTMGAGLTIKRMLVGTAAGRVAVSVRDAFSLWLAPRVEAGSLINDQIASRLAVGFCPPHGTFVDIGAHIGSVIADVQFRRPLARIVAFEPIPEKATALRRKFPTVAVHQLALWDSEGQVSFFVDDARSAYSSLHHQAGTREITVPTRRLDAVLGDVSIDVIKLDVEGAELGVLRGATGVLQKSRPIIMFESGPEIRFNFTKQSMFEFFRSNEYDIFAPNRLAHTGEAMTLDAFLDSHEYPRRTTNYFALPSERTSAIRAQARLIKL